MELFHSHSLGDVLLASQKTNNVVVTADETIFFRSKKQQHINCLMTLLLSLYAMIINQNLVFDHILLQIEYPNSVKVNTVHA